MIVSFPGGRSLPKRGILLRKNISSMEIKFFSLSVHSHLKRLTNVKMAGLLPL